MLIKCPECKNEFSDKTESCPHCGFPTNLISYDNYCNINGKMIDLSEIVEILPNVGDGKLDISPLHISSLIQDLSSLDWNNSKELAKIIIETQQIPKEYNGKTEVTTPYSNANSPKCPTCQSSNLHKISTTSKAVNTVAFGLLGTKRNKTFHCNNCGYEW